MFGIASGLGSGTGRGAAPSGWADVLPAAGRPWAGAIDAAATTAGVDPRLLAAITQAESGFNPGALSSAGAVGLTQLMPGTASGLGVDPTDPVANLDGGGRYLAGQLDSFGRVDLAVAAYNAGPGAVRQAGGVPDYPETQAYVRRVLGYYQQLGGTL
jgi:soluble lytic murein transglycosylase-like protein